MTKNTRCIAILKPKLSVDSLNASKKRGTNIRKLHLYMSYRTGTLKTYNKRQWFQRRLRLARKSDSLNKGMHQSEMQGWHYFYKLYIYLTPEKLELMQDDGLMYLMSLAITVIPSSAPRWRNMTSSRVPSRYACWDIHSNKLHCGELS